MTLEPYQLAAAQWLAKQKRGAVIAPAGAGKTLVAAKAIALVLEARPRTGKVKIGWVAFTREQVEQAWKALNAFPAIAQLADVEVRCAQAYQDWSDKAAIIIDESHKSTSPVFLKQMRTCPGAVWGFTATPKSSDPERDKLFHDLFGGNLHVVPRSAVANRLVSARVIMLDASDECREAMDTEIQRLMNIRKRQFSRFKPDEREIYRMVSWQVARSIGIEQNVMRNEAIIQAVSPERRTIVLVNNVEHALALEKRIPFARACYAKMGAKRRREALQAFRDGSVFCLIATSLADEGLDLPMAEVLVLASGGRSAAKAEQRTGRVLRTFAGKSEGVIYDFLDRQHPTMENQAKARMALYKKLGYRIELPW